VQVALGVPCASESISWYVVNAVGNRTSMTDSAGTTAWTYDNLDRLTNVSYPNGDTVAYGYEKVGDRISHMVNGVTKTNTFDDANRITASGTDTYTYDANGNQTGKTSGSMTTTYSYDALDWLINISSGGTVGSYVYDGDGDFLMNSQELETAKRLGTAFVCVVLEDSRYGVIALNQRRRFGHTFGVDFGNPDFVAYAASFGLPGFRVASAGELLPTLRRALDLDTPSVVAVPVDSSRSPASLAE
jgi:YD repeat-containing protein